MNATPRAGTTPVLAEHRGVQSQAAALFPSESAAGIVLSQEELFRLSPLFAAVYRAVAAALASGLSAASSASPAAASVIARRAGVPLAHAFLDRAIRLDRLTRAVQGPLAVADEGPFPVPETFEAFQTAAASSPAFNQALLARLAPLWAIPVEPAKAAPRAENEDASPFRNNNFDFAADGLAGLPRKAFAKFVARPLSRLLSRHATTSMAYADPLFRGRGFYFRLLHQLPRDWALSSPPRDEPSRRRHARADSPEVARAVSALLAAAEIPAPRREAVIAALGDFIADFLPAPAFEGLAENLSRARTLLAPFRGRALVFAEAGSTTDAFLLAAAREQNVSLVRCQHGGHYGYLRDNADAEELEYALSDRFVSWGWTRADLKVTVLPSPWLSERARYWRERGPAVPDAAKPFDFLLMTNKLKRFAHAPTGAVVSRVDLIRPFADNLTALVAEAARRGARILHKPYNRATQDLLPKTFEELKRLGGANYSQYEGFDKGLTPELLGLCRVVLWDQPGTGFLECLASGIPSMVFWPRTYNEEEAAARPFFKDLEAAGLVHRDAASLVEAALAFKSAPDAWRTEPRRLAAISRFRDEYARTDDDWESAWRDFLRSL